MKALERPSYLNKQPDVKVWEVQVEKGYEVSFNSFTDMQQAKRFAAKHNVTFYPDEFKWVPQAKLATLRGLKKIGWFRIEYTQGFSLTPNLEDSVNQL